MADTPTLEQIAQALWDASEAFTEEGPRGFGAAPKPVLMAMAEAVADLYAPAVEPRSSGEREAEYRRLVQRYANAIVSSVDTEDGTGVGEHRDALDAFVLPLLRQRGPDSPTLDGARLIAAERQRQVEAEGWTAEHDDDHTEGALVRAAATYAMAPVRLFDKGEGQGVVAFTDIFPSRWRDKSAELTETIQEPGRAPRKIVRDRIRLLVIAGALIAAEIDRLNRAALSRETP